MAANDLIEVTVEFGQSEFELLVDAAKEKAPADWLREVALMVIAADRAQEERDGDDINGDWDNEPENNTDPGPDSVGPPAATAIAEEAWLNSERASRTESLAHIEEVVTGNRELLAWVKMAMKLLLEERETRRLMTDHRNRWLGIDHEVVAQQSHERAANRLKEAERAVAEWLKSRPEKSNQH